MTIKKMFPWFGFLLLFLFYAPLYADSIAEKEKYSGSLSFDTLPLIMSVYDIKAQIKIDGMRTIVVSGNYLDQTRNPYGQFGTLHYNSFGGGINLRIYKELPKWISDSGLISPYLSLLIPFYYTAMVFVDLEPGTPSKIMDGFYAGPTIGYQIFSEQQTWNTLPYSDSIGKALGIGFESGTQWIWYGMALDTGLGSSWYFGDSSRIDGGDFNINYLQGLHVNLHLTLGYAWN